MLYQTLSHTLKLAPHESPSRRTLNNYAIFYAKPSRKTLNKFGKPSTTLIIRFDLYDQGHQRPCSDRVENLTFPLYRPSFLFYLVCTPCTPMFANANKRKSRAITHSFGMKLRALMLGKEVEITFCDVQRTKKKYKFTDEERLSFVLFGILYASRCNNFHGNVAARMNSINANKDTFKMYTDMFLTEYIILAIHLNSQGALPDMVLNKVKENANLMV